VPSAGEFAASALPRGGFAVPSPCWGCGGDRIGPSWGRTPGWVRGAAVGWDRRPSAGLITNFVLISAVARVSAPVPCLSFPSPGMRVGLLPAACFLHRSSASSVRPSARPSLRFVMVRLWGCSWKAQEEAWGSEIFSAGKGSRGKGPTPVWTHSWDHQPRGVPGPGELPPQFIRRDGAMRAGKVAHGNVVPVPGLLISPLMSLNCPRVPIPAWVREGTGWVRDR